MDKPESYGELPGTIVGGSPHVCELLLHEFFKVTTVTTGEKSPCVSGRGREQESFTRLK